ncbi:MAG TPA: hypothetical protein VNC78_12150 [Actinomycetota bacterium]|nr:hypothetical protein [Actinomycetota bacterium]
MHPLAILREMSNKDKHRQVNVILFFLPGVLSTVDTGDLETLLGEMHDKLIIDSGSIRLPYRDGFTRGMDVHFTLTPQVSTTEMGDEEGDVIALASYLFEFVCESVVAPLRLTCFPWEKGVHLPTPLPREPRRRIQREGT